MTRAFHELLGETLVAAGYRGLDEQAKALGLPRSTAWTILKANHKNSGLSATVITRMLAAPDLPGTVRVMIFEYVDDKARARKFRDRIGARLATSPS